MRCANYSQEKEPIETGIFSAYNALKTPAQNINRPLIEDLLRKEAAQYNHLDYQRKNTSNPQNMQQSTLEMLAYSAITFSHARASLSKPSDTQNYIAANGNQTITLTEGYIKELNLGYLSLTVAKGGEKQDYQLIVRYNGKKERNIKAEKEIAEEIAKLSQKLSKEDSINDGEVIETLTATLKKKKLRLELTEEEIELVRQTKENKGLQKRIWLIDKKRKTFRKLEIESEIQQLKGIATEYTNPAITLNYSENGNYTGRIERAQNDFTNLVPPKNINKFPVSLMGGVLGFTYLGDSFVGIRDDLNEHEANEVEIHEAIHTPDEYETRVITKWMLDDNTHYH